MGLSSCTSDSDDGVVTLAGHAMLADSTGQPLPNFSGVIVSVDGTKFSTTTDSTGIWQIANLPQGEYNVTATKSGFGTYHWYEQTFEPGRYDLAPIALAQLTPATALIRGISWNNDNPMAPELDFGAYTQPKTFGDNTVIEGYCDLDSLAQPSDPHLATTLDLTTSIDSGGLVFYRNDLLAAGVRPGQRLFLSCSIVYQGSYYTGKHGPYLSEFFDPQHNEMRYATIGPKSNVLSILMQ
jgi:hypothetical protein